MPFNLNKIISGVTSVGQGGIIINANIDKQIVSGNTSGQNLRLVSKDGTQETINLSSVTSNYITSAATQSLLNLKYDKSGGTITGLVRVQDGSGTSFIDISGNSRTINFFDDVTGTGNKIVAVGSDSGIYTHILPSKGGTFAMLSDIPTGGTSGTTYTFSAGTDLKVTTGGNLITYTYTGSTGTTYVAGIGIQISGSVISFTGSTSGGTSVGITGLTSIGEGITSLSAISNNNIIQKTFSGSNGISIVDGPTIVISYTGSTSSGSGVTGATNAGGGASVYQSAGTSDLVFRSISGSNGIGAVVSGQIILIKPSGTTANRVYVTDASGNMINSASLFVDNTNGTLGVNIAASTTSRLLLATQTATISPLRFTKGATNITSPTDGDIWYLTSGDTLKFRKGTTTTTDFVFADSNQRFTGSTSFRMVESNSGGTLSATRNLTTFGVFNALTSVTVSSTTAETSIISTNIVGSQTLLSSSDANTPQLITGKKFRFSAFGSINTKASAAGTIRVRVKIGSVVICDTSATTLVNNVTVPNVFDINVSFTVRTQGVSGKIIGSGYVNCSEPFILTSKHVLGLFDQGDVTVDTTANRLFDCTVQFDTDDSDNIITINQSTLEYLN